MISPVQQVINGDEDEVIFVDDDAPAPPHLRVGQQAAGVKKMDMASAQVGQRVFQSADNEKEKSPLRPRRVNLPSLDALGNLRDDQVQEVFNLVEQLKVRYESWKENFKGQVAFQGALLAGVEYFSANKENIAKAAKQIKSSLPDIEVKSWLDKGDLAYKWSDDILHLIAYIRKYHMLNDIQNELSKYHQQLQDLEARLPKSSSNPNRIRKVQKYIDSFNREIKKEKKDVGNKGMIKGMRFVMTKLTSYPLEHLAQLSSKISVKLGKHVFNIFRDIQGIRNVLQAGANQSEWLYHLQPRLTVNIYSNDSDESAQNELKQQHKTAQEKLLVELKKFMTSLEHCKTTGEVKTVFEQVGIPFEIPSNFKEFERQLKDRRFQRNLIQKYYYRVGQRAIMNEAHIDIILRAKVAEKKRLIDKRLPFISDQIIACQNMQWSEIQDHFANLHIHLDSIQIVNSKDSSKKLSEEPDLSEPEDSSEEDVPEELSEDLVHENLPIPPTTKAEWDQCIQNDEFVRALAKQWVDYQEAKAQLFSQAMRQCLLSKHNIEGRFLNFRLKQYFIGLVSTAIQLAICIPYVKLYALSSALEILSKDLAKAGFPGAGAFYLFIPLYPDFNFRLEGILLHLDAHFFGIKYKPNEYSLKSYQLAFQIRMCELMMTGHTILLFMKQVLLWLNMRLIENCIMGLRKKNLSDDDRFKRMDEQYEQHRINCKHCVEELQASLNELKIRDTKLTLNPNYGKSKTKLSQAKESLNNPIQNAEESDDSDLEFEEEMKEAEKKTFVPMEKNFDPLHALVQALEDADLECFPPNVLEAFEDNFGFQLTDKTKENLQERLERFFSESETKFIDSFNSNRFNYLIRV